VGKLGHNLSPVVVCLGVLKLLVLDDISKDAINWWKANQLFLSSVRGFLPKIGFVFLYDEALSNRCIL
jgi:hypothetical protein